MPLCLLGGALGQPLQRLGFGATEGLGALPRRLMVADEDWARATLLLRAAEPEGETWRGPDADFPGESEE